MKKVKINQYDKISRLFLFVFISALLSPVLMKADDDKKAVIQLTFDQKDSTNNCTAKVTADGVPVKKVSVHFYVKSLFALLPVGEAVETDSLGTALAVYPKDLPGDKNGNYTAVVKIEDDDNYGTVVSQADVKWGVAKVEGLENWNKRSLSASREKAPMYLIVASVLIIAAVWGTIFYIIFQVFRIKKESILIKKS